MLAIITFAALASAMPITTEHTIPSSTLFESTSAFTKRAADAAVKMVQRSVCDIDADGLTPHDCPHVNSVLRAAFALFCLFAFLVGLHVWQAAKYNKIQAVFGTYIADDMEGVNAKPHYILLDEPESPRDS